VASEEFVLSRPDKDGFSCYEDGDIKIIKAADIKRFQHSRGKFCGKATHYLRK
jgi:hypothetical protein